MGLRHLTVQCQCGAAYERREVRIPIRDIGSFDCTDCGARIEIWSGKMVPLFVRVKTPEDTRRRA